MVLSVDFDETISEHTYELRELMNAMSATGHRTLVVSGRKNPEPIKEFLQKNGFPEMEIVTKDDNSTVRAFKSKALASNGVDVHIDNDELSLPTWHPTKVMTFQKSRIRFGRFERNK